MLFTNVWSSPGLINIPRPLPTLCLSYLTLYSQHRRQSNPTNQGMSFCLEASVAHLYSNRSQSPGIKDDHTCPLSVDPISFHSPPHFLSCSNSALLVFLDLPSPQVFSTSSFPYLESFLPKYPFVHWQLKMVRDKYTTSHSWGVFTNAASFWGPFRPLF